jgi:hypothetical protein
LIRDTLIRDTMFTDDDGDNVVLMIMVSGILFRLEGVLLG